MGVRNRVAVRDSRSIESAVVTAWSPIVRGLLGYHVQWRCPWTRRRSDDAQSEHVFKLILSDAKLLRVKSSRLSMNWVAGGDNMVSDLVTNLFRELTWASEGWVILQNVSKRRAWHSQVYTGGRLTRNCTDGEERSEWIN